MDFPQLYQNDEGVELVADNDIQAAAFENGGFKPVGNAPDKKTRKQQ